METVYKGNLIVQHSQNKFSAFYMNESGDIEELHCDSLEKAKQKLDVYAKREDIYTLSANNITKDEGVEYPMNLMGQIYTDKHTAIEAAREVAKFYLDDKDVICVYVMAGEYFIDGDIYGDPFDIYTVSNKPASITAFARKQANYVTGKVTECIGELNYGENDHIQSVEDVRKFFRHLLYDIGVNFHPDDDFSEYLEYESFEPTFTPDEIVIYNRLMNESFAICNQIGENKIYEVAIEEFAVFNRESPEDSQKHCDIQKPKGFSELWKENKFDTKGVLMYSYSRKEFVVAKFGDGSNLNDEDLRHGMDDYIYIATFKYSSVGNLNEEDGACLTFNTDKCDYHSNLESFIRDSLDMIGYSPSDDHIVLEIFDS